MKRILFVVFLLLSCLSIHAESVYYGFAELTLDESFVYKFVKALDTKSRKAVDILLGGKNETEDKSIIKRGEGEWYVRKDYPLPEGNYYESYLYRRDNGQIDIILPRITVMTGEAQLAEVMEYIGNKVTLGSGNNDYGNRYYLDCQVKTSEEVLEICLFLYNCAFDYGILGVKLMGPDIYRLNPDADSYLIRILKDSTQPFVPKHEGEKLIYEMDWQGVRYVVSDAPEGIWEGTADGLAINNPSIQDLASSPLTSINDSRDIILEKNHDYIVRVTLKAPSDGIYQVNLSSFNGQFYEFDCQAPVSASDEFQEIDFEYPKYPYDEEHALIFFGCGWVVGTTIVKKVQVIEKIKGGETAIKTTKPDKADGAVYNLSGQKVDASYKGIVIQNGKKRIAH